MSDDITRLDAEITRLRAEVQAVEMAPRSFDERWPEIEHALSEAEAAFRKHGALLNVAPAVLPEHVWLRHQVSIGASVVANRKAVLDAERARIKAATEGSINAADKARRLEELRGEILRAAARRELLLREAEAHGEFMSRPVHAELAIFQHSDVERLAR